MSAPGGDPVRAARDYYDSPDADFFYASIWGGEDIHIGLYAHPDEPVYDASRRTVEEMAARVDGLGQKTRVLDLGSGYGGAARYLAKTKGCHVVGLNLSEVENRRAESLNAEQGIEDRVRIVTGSFENIPFEDGAFDVVWSQDAILHSGNRERVLQEVSRVLAPGGQFVFTDPMQSDTCPEGALQPILDRIHLASLGSPGFYRNMCETVGLEFDGFEELTEQLVNHYGRILGETTRRAAALSGHVSPEYIERMQSGLRHWIDGGRDGLLAWGIFRFRKPR